MVVGMAYRDDIGRVRFKLAIVILVSLLVFSCKDKGGCPPNFIYVPSYQLCLNLPSVDAQDGGFVDDAGLDTPEGDPESGLGMSCRTDANCEDYEADFCITDPMNPKAPGYCTYIHCSPGECPSGWQCCDCTKSGLVPDDFRIAACFDQNKAQLAVTLAGCGCV